MAATATKPKKSATSAAVKPIGDKILVQRDEAETITDSGIYLPESAKDKPKSGTVISVGDGNINTDTGKRIALTVKKGDKVIFNSYAGTEVKLGTDELLILSESEVLAIID